MFSTVEVAAAAVHVLSTGLFSGSDFNTIITGKRRLHRPMGLTKADNIAACNYLLVIIFRELVLSQIAASNFTLQAFFRKIWHVA